VQRALCPRVRAQRRFTARLIPALVCKRPRMLSAAEVLVGPGRRRLQPGSDDRVSVPDRPSSLMRRALVGEASRGRVGFSHQGRLLCRCTGGFGLASASVVTMVSAKGPDRASPKLVAQRFEPRFRTASMAVLEPGNQVIPKQTSRPSTSDPATRVATLDPSRK
jgi:hypothetical protein